MVDPVQPRVRFAPNGEVKFAALFTRPVLYTWLFARRYGGKFVLRFDDTALNRQEVGAFDSYLSGMDWLGLECDEGPEIGGPYGPYRQSERLELYYDHLKILERRGRTFPCFCGSAIDRHAKGVKDPCRDLGPAERAAGHRRNSTPAARFRTPTSGSLESTDMLRGPISVSAAAMPDFVVQRSGDGWPTYHLCVVVDDHHMRISHVIRGNEGLANMAPQALMCEAFGYHVPEYLHHPLIKIAGFNSNDRTYDTSQLILLDDLRRLGYVSEAVVNYYAQLAASYPGGEDLMSIERLIAEFDYRRISRRTMVEQDPRKLAWFNRQYIQRALPAEEVLRRCSEIVEDSYPDEGPARIREALREIVPGARNRMQVLNDAIDLVRFVFDKSGFDSPLAGEERIVVTAALRVLATSGGENLLASVAAVSGSDAAGVERTLKRATGLPRYGVTVASGIRILGIREVLARWSRALELSEKVT
jgi:glutamyl/glutaminyl-tRNA synthetase